MITNFYSVSEVCNFIIGTITGLKHYFLGQPPLIWEIDLTVNLLSYILGISQSNKYMDLCLFECVCTWICVYLSECVHGLNINIRCLRCLL